jgi:hypothetical protein
MEKITLKDSNRNFTDYAYIFRKSPINSTSYSKQYQMQKIVKKPSTIAYSSAEVHIKDTYSTSEKTVTLNNFLITECSNSVFLIQKLTIEKDNSISKVRFVSVNDHTLTIVLNLAITFDWNIMFYIQHKNLYNEFLKHKKITKKIKKMTDESKI